MNEFQEKRQIKQAVPVVTQPVGDTEYRSVVHERRGVSGVAIAALVMAAIAVAVIITMLIMNNQQRTRDDQLAQERAVAPQSASQPSPAPQPSQQSPAVIVTPSAPTTTSVPAPGGTKPATAPSARSNVEIELDITSKFVDDPDLRSYPIDVKVSEGVATLSGELPKESLKAQAERLARRVKGVESVINNLTVQAQS